MTVHKSIGAIKPHWSYWFVVFIILVWHLPAIIDVFSPGGAETKSAAQQAIQDTLAQRPSWATVAFALFAIAGLLGAILLLIRSSFAMYLFVVSLIGALVHMIGLFSIADAPTPMKVGCILSLAGAVLFIWYSRFASGKNWLRSSAQT